jgi:hypothetical protein
VGGVAWQVIESHLIGAATGELSPQKVETLPLWYLGSLFWGSGPRGSQNAIAFDRVVRWTTRYLHRVVASESVTRCVHLCVKKCSELWKTLLESFSGGVGCGCGEKSTEGECAKISLLIVIGFKVRKLRHKIETATRMADYLSRALRVGEEGKGCSCVPSPIVSLYTPPFARDQPPQIAPLQPMALDLHRFLNGCIT